MADLLKKISDLTAGTPAETDIVPYVDLATNTTKKALKSELKGEKGDTGTAATVDVGTTTTVVTTVPAAVTNSGTTSAAIFDFVIPKGETGDTGPAGADGLSCVWKGAWLTSTSYILQEIVSYGGSSYVCIEAHTSGTFATDLAAGKWELACEAGLDITWKGAYDNGTAYVVNDAVSYNGSSYICIASTTGNLPTNDTYWNLMALKGTDGSGSGDVLGPATNTDSYIPQWDGVNSKTLKNGLGLDTDLTSVSASDDTVPSAKATKTALDLKAPLASPTFTGTVTLPVGLTGVLRADTGVVSTDSDVTDLVTDAAADGSTKGKAAFNANDFSAASGVITIDYANGQKASTTQAGFVTELATAAETTAGTDESRVLTPDGLSGSDYGKRVVGILAIDPATNTSTGDGKAYFRVPSVMNGWNLVGVAAQVYTAGTTNTTDIQIRNVTDSVDMLSTKMTIDSGEKDTSTAATPAVIDTTKDDVATGDQIAIDVDAISTTAAKGLYVELIFQLP